MKNLFVILLSIAIISITSATAQKKNKKLSPVGVEFQKETLKRLGSVGDNWCITWAKDGGQITSMCDGNWLNLDNPEGDYNTFNFHNHLFRIVGDAESFQREDIPNYPNFSGKEGSWFGYGIVSVNGSLYSTISKTPLGGWSGPFSGIKLLKSPDNGNSWYRVSRFGQELLLGVHDSIRNVVNKEEMFFLKEEGMPHKERIAYPFSFVSFVQDGQDNSASKDDYIYIYSPEGAHSNKLLLARVSKDKLENRSFWQYFVKYDKANNPIWTKDLSMRGYIYEYPEKNNEGNYFGWYSWLPSVVWNEGLGLYIMVNGGTYAGHGMTDSDKDYYDGWMHTETGSLGFWYSKNPYGPWTQFYYTDSWIVDNEKNRNYQPKLSPKWISKDGKDMILIWSDAMANEKGESHADNYLWNQMGIKIITE